jgi:diguanylate cyclase (GGDEF)-like protein/PAS domain S-box-containing protein
VDSREAGRSASALQESEARLQVLISALDDIVIEMDAQGAYLGVWANRESLLAAPHDELIGSKIADFMSEEVSHRLVEVNREVLESGQAKLVEYSRESPSGVRWFQARVAPVVGASGPSRRVCMLVRDVTDQKAEEKQVVQLLRRERLLSRLSDAVPMGLFEVDIDGRIVFANDRLRAIIGQRLFGGGEEQVSPLVTVDWPLVSAAFRAVLGGQSVDDVEIHLRRADGDPSGAGLDRVCSLSMRSLTDADGAVTGAVGCLSDVSERVQLRRGLWKKASVDKLTSCPNREASFRALDRMCATLPPSGSGNALVFVDIDDFKSVNDQFGHAAGDRVLAQSSALLGGAARKGDTVGRVGGDEFIVMCPSVDSPSEAVRVAQRFADVTRTAVDVGVCVVEMRTSVGVAWTDHAVDADKLIAQADSAMYASKHSGSAAATLYSETGESQRASSKRPFRHTRGHKRN